MRYVIECPDCEGVGEVETDEGDMIGCSLCEGEGEIDADMDEAADYADNHRPGKE